MAKITSNQKLFADLIVKLTGDSFNEATNYINQLLIQQKEHRDKINNIIGNVLLRYNVKDNVMDLSTADKKKIYNEINKKINIFFKSEIRTETEQVREQLKTIGEQQFNINDYVYSMGVNYNLKPVSEKVLNNIINTKIDSKLWSDRIWDNKNQVARTLKKEIHDFLNGKTNINDINKIINNRFSVNASNTNRLVRTEICRVQEQANEHWCNQHNIKQQLFTATLDSKTSKICQNHDGQIYDMDDKNKPVPPLHPNCRSCLVAVVDKDWKPQKRTNNETKEMIDFKSYEKWLEKSR